jgi:ADP-heptose:LPS heptosyltransferase
MAISNYVLLTNANAEKGYDLILKVAALLPDVPFLVIASQSPLSEAIHAYEIAGLRNITAIERVADMGPIYRGAAVVAVPSYRFRESFSRVCIEAQRHEKPVIGSDQGNVPYLLEHSGVSLPEDPKLWAAEIMQLLNDPAYYRERCDKALENSARYSYADQGAALDNLVGAGEARFLVAVGSGIGNMLHTTPMIANISRRIGARVDVVVAEEHPKSLFVVHNPDYVNAVFGLKQAVLRRAYDTVFVTHSFGQARVAFNCANVVWARDWESFRVNGLHETIYNLEAAKQLLGIPYDESDVRNYFCGDLTYRRPAEPLVGIHAGSKAGMWLIKRWPHFPELARRLRRRGIRVASFGVASEYVEGTENRTGATIEAMCESMLDCSHFVSNDSGVMNIANALGIPVIGLFAPTNVKTRLPLGLASTAIVLERDCAPCELKDPEGFGMGQCRCMADITVDEVEAALLARMQAGLSALAAVLCAPSPPFSPMAKPPTRSRSWRSRASACTMRHSARMSTGNWRCSTTRFSGPSNVRMRSTHCSQSSSR